MSGSAGQRIFFLSALLLVAASTSWAYHHFQSGWVHFRAAEARLAAGDPVGAEAVLREMLQKDPRNRRARLALARFSSRAGRLEEAVRHYKIYLGEADPVSKTGKGG